MHTLVSRATLSFCHHRHLATASLVLVAGLTLVGCKQKTAATTQAAPAAEPAQKAARAPTPAPEGALASPAKAPPSVKSTAVAEDVRQLFAAVNDDPKTSIVSAKRTPAAFEVTYRTGATPPVERTVYVSLDGAWIASGLVDLRHRLIVLRDDLRYADCMERQGVKIYVAPKEDASQKQLAELGSYGERVVIDCGDERRALCEANGVRSFPTFVWREGSEIGLRSRSDIGLATGCK